MKVIFGDQNNKDYGEGWVTVDWRNADVNLYWDEVSRFKFWKDNEIDMVYTSHTIEHMTDETVENLFREFYIEF